MSGPAQACHSSKHTDALLEEEGDGKAVMTQPVVVPEELEEEWSSMASSPVEFRSISIRPTIGDDQYFRC